MSNKPWERYESNPWKQYQGKSKGGLPQGPVYLEPSVEPKPVIEAMGTGALSSLVNLGEKIALPIYQQFDPTFGMRPEQDDSAIFRKHVDSYRESNPFATGLGEAVPFMALPFGSASTAVGLPMRAAGNTLKQAPRMLTGTRATGRGIASLGESAAASGAIDTALIGALEGAVTDRGMSQGAAEGLLGYAGGKALGGILSKSGSMLPKHSRKIVQEAIDAGYKLKPGERTGSLSQRQLDQSFTRYPVTADVVQSLEDFNKRKATKALIKAIGGDEDNLSLDKRRLEGLLRRQGQNIGKLTNKTKLNFTGDDLVKIISLEDSFRARPQVKGNEGLANEFSGWVNEISQYIKSTQTGDIMAGSDYHKLRHDLWARSQQMKRQVINTDPVLTEHIDALNKTLDNVYKRSAGSDEWKKLQNARQRYAVGMMAKDKSVVDQATGLVDMTRLGRELDKTTYSRQNMPDSLKDIYLAGDLGRLQSDLRSAGSLSTSQFLGNFIRGGNSEKEMMKKFYMASLAGAGQVPFLGNAVARGYFSGYPAATGLVPLLPSGSGMVTGGLLGRTLPTTDQGNALYQKLNNSVSRGINSVSEWPDDILGLLQTK